jgi:hypothetical protein
MQLKLRECKDKHAMARWAGLQRTRPDTFAKSPDGNNLLSPQQNGRPRAPDSRLAVDS